MRGSATVFMDDADPARRLLAHMLAKAAAPTAPAGEQDPDDTAVDRFAAAMKAKLAKKRAEGRSGWDDKGRCSQEFLSRLLRDHVGKGDPVDVANLAMMLHQRGEVIQQPVSDPDGPGRVLMPRALTAENGAKAALSGEFSVSMTVTCSACHYDEPDDECEFCGGEREYQQSEAVPWTTIKRIYSAAVDLLSAPAPDEREIAAREIAGALDWINYQIAETPKPQEGYSYRGGVIEGMRTAATRLSDALDRLRAGKEGKEHA